MKQTLLFLLAGLLVGCSSIKEANRQGLEEDFLRNLKKYEGTDGVVFQERYVTIIRSIFYAIPSDEDRARFPFEPSEQHEVTATLRADVLEVAGLGIPKFSLPYDSIDSSMRTVEYGSDGKLNISVYDSGGNLVEKFKGHVRESVRREKREWWAVLVNRENSTERVYLKRSEKKYRVFGYALGLRKL